MHDATRFADGQTGRWAKLVVAKMRQKCTMNSAFLAKSIVLFA